MKKYLLIFVTILAGCSENEPRKNSEFSDQRWMKLTIPGARAVYAMAGSIEDTLLVSTWTKAYYTADGGNTWFESFDFHGPVFGFEERSDTIFALRSLTHDMQGNPLASLAQFYTVNHGQDWKPINRHLVLKKSIGRVSLNSGVEYFLKQNSTPVSPGSNNAYINPTDVMKSDVDGVNKIPFPYPHHILNLHRDVQQRLYLGISAASYQEETNTFSGWHENESAILYVSRSVMP
jgi:hypothetical protein